MAQWLLFIGSPTAIKKEGASFGTHPVGAGPFILNSWVRNSQKSFTANPGYYQPGLPYLSKLVIDVIPDSSQGVTALKTGQGNYMYTQDSSVISQLKAAGMQATTTTTPGSPNFAFNNKKPPFNDPSIRKAVAEAVSVDQMAKVTGTFVPVSRRSRRARRTTTACPGQRTTRVTRSSCSMPTRRPTAARSPSPSRPSRIPPPARRRTSSRRRWASSRT